MLDKAQTHDEGGAATRGPLLEVNNLSAEFRLKGGSVRAVNGVSFSLDSGQTIAIVGESGSGKSATALSLLRLNPEPPCVYTAGSIKLGGHDILKASEAELERIRGNEIAMIFQDPMTSLNPLMTIGAQVAEAVSEHQRISRKAAAAAAIDALAEVGIADPVGRARQYPHQFSGGMRQRAMIAMALATKPRVLVADEPTTALDVTVQAQIVELLRKLQQRHGTAIILITHDLGLVADIADRVLVMYAGRVVEDASAPVLFRNPQMPYTRALLEAVPRIDAAPGEGMRAIGGQPPDLKRLGVGCPFAPRCSYSFARCNEATPLLVQREPGHLVACHLSRDELVAAHNEGGR